MALDDAIGQVVSGVLGDTFDVGGSGGSLWVATSSNLVKFAADVLNKIDAPETYGNLMFLVTWMAKEGQVAWEEGTQEHRAAFNPLNTTKLFGENSQYPGDPAAARAQRVADGEAAGMSFFNELEGDNVGVMNYRDWDQGVDATARTLRDSFPPGSGDRPVFDLLRQEGGTSLAGVLADPGTQATFRGWSGNSYSSLEGMDPTAFRGHGEHGVASAVQGYLVSIDQADLIPEGESVVDTGSTDDTGASVDEPSGAGFDASLDETMEALGQSKGQFFRVAATPLATGGAAAGGYDPTYTYYYALPLLTTAKVAAGDSVAVYWQIDSLPTGVEWMEYTRADWLNLVDGNPDWVPSVGGIITPTFNEAGFFLTPDDDHLPINELVKQLVTEAFLAGTDAIEHREIQQIIAQAIADPKMFEAVDYVQLLIDATPWGQARTELSKGWDRATIAEREAMVQRVLEDTSSGLYKQFEYYTGEPVQPNQRMNVGDLSLLKWAEAIAKGERSYWDAGSAIKKYALDLPGKNNNPYKIHVFDTEVAGRQYGVDLESKIQELEVAYAKWGLSPGEYAWDVKTQAEGILDNTYSMTQVMDDIRATASEKFPGKPDLLSTTEYATPKVNMYNLEMETPLDASYPLGNEDLMASLMSGESPTEFRTRLRGKDEWKRSRRAKEITADKMNTMESTFGFGGGVGRIV